MCKQLFEDREKTMASYRTDHGTSMATLLGVACVLYAHRRPRSLSSETTEARRSASLVRSLGMVLWPMVLFHLVPRRHHACLVPRGFLWVGAMWLLDEYLLFHNHDVTGRDDERADARGPAKEAWKSTHSTLPRSLRIDPGSVTALAFGTSSLLGVRGCENEHTPLFLIAVVGSLITTFVSHELPPDSDLARLFENVQRVVLVWCIGIVLVAVQLTHATNSFPKTHM